MTLTLNGKKVLERTLLHAQEFVLDADGDSSLTADTDDQLDLRLGGNDVFVFKTSELDITGVNIVNCGDIALDSISDDDSTGINIAMTDASATALTIKEAATAYLTFDTSNGTENIILGKKLTGGAVEIEGSAFDINGGTIDGITSLTVGTDGSGADVCFYSATGGDHLFWDSSEELLTITGTNGQTALNVADGNMIVADTFYLFDAGGEYLSSDGADLTIASGALINLTATSDVVIPVNIGLIFGDGAEKIESNNTDFTINSGVDINLTAVADINVPANVGMTFGNDGEKIEGDATDLTIASSNLLNLAAATDVVIPVNVGLHLGDGAEKLESNNTDLTINSGVDINLTATTDINVPANVGMTFGDDGEKIEGDGTDLTIASSGVLNLNATSGIAINGQDITNGGVIFLTEQAAAEGDVEAKGQIWVKTATPNQLWFTDDAGADVQLGLAGGAHAILDGSVHSDSVADAVTRGSLIYGNSTPKWDELVIGGANTFVGSDGTDVSYRSAAQVLVSLSGAAGAAFAWNGQNLTGIGTIGCGVITITPGAAGTFLDFELETEWVSGTLIRADFGGATTLNNDAVVVGLDFNSNVSLTTDKDLTGYQIKLPAFTQSAANTTTIIGFDLPTAGALVQDTDAGTLAWQGINIQMPNITQTTGTVTARGMLITAGTLTSGAAYGIDIAGSTTRGINISGAASSAQLYIGGTDILANGEQAIYVNCPSEDGATNAAWFTLGSTVTSGDVTGLRSRVTGNAASGGANIRGAYSEAFCGASKHVATLQGILAHASVAAGTCTVATTQVIYGIFGTGDSFTGTDVYVGYLKAQTRGTETIGGNYCLLGLENEAVGGNGKQMDSAIRIFATNVSTPYAFGYGIDLSGAVGEIATADIKLSDGSVINDSNGYWGIGTASPACNLHVQGDSNTGYTGFRIGNTDGAGATGYRMYGSGATGTFGGLPRANLGFMYCQGADNLLIETYDSAPLVFGQNNAEVMRIHSNGNVGIKTTNPGVLLDIGLAGTTLGVIRLEGSTSGYVQLQPAVAAGSWTLTFPANDGDNGQVLATDGNGVTSWAAAAAVAGQIFLTSAGGWPSTTNGCAAPVKTGHGTNDIDVYTLDFDKDSDEFAQWTVAMPSDYDGGTITAVFYWTYATGSGAETVEWNIMGRSYANDEAIDQAWGTEQDVSDAAIAAGDVHISAATSACTLGGTPAASELVQFRAYRDVSGDNLAGDARLIGAMIGFTRS